jgi:hypothetical protein
MPEYVTRKIAVPKQMAEQEPITNSANEIIFAEPVILINNQGEFYTPTTTGGSNSTGSLTLSRNNISLTISHLYLVLADTEYSFSLVNVSKYKFKNLSNSLVRFSNVQGKVANSILPYYTLDGTGEEKEEFPLDSKFSGDFFFASSGQNTTIVFQTWSSPESTSKTNNIYFSSGDVSERLIYIAEANEIILTVTVVILQAFNGIGPTISIGDSVNNSRLANNSQIYLDQVGEYNTNPSYKYTSNTPINLYLNQGTGATQCAGYIVIESTNN